MSKLIHIDSGYASWIQEIGHRFRKHQLQASVKVNMEMLRFYWSLGADIVNLEAESRWGDKFFQQLSLDLNDILPGVKGFSVTNLGYMKRFYLLYNHYIEIHPQVGGKLLAETTGRTPTAPQEVLFSIPWGHHKYIIDKFYGDADKAFFYVCKTIENGWSRSVLLHFIDTNLYERQGKAISNFSSHLPPQQSDLAQEFTKDPYNFDFLTLTEGYWEKELKEALVRNITKFLLELGTGFAFVGKEFRIEIGKTEKFIDMLFYNLNLRCFVVVELKTGEFDGAHIGQLGTYVAAVNHTLRRQGDNPTIGLLICKTKDNVLAKYALESSNQPIGISEYELSRLYPLNFKGTLPSIEEIEKELQS